MILVFNIFKFNFVFCLTAGAHGAKKVEAHWTRGDDGIDSWSTSDCYRNAIAMPQQCCSSEELTLKAHDDLSFALQLAVVHLPILSKHYSCEVATIFG